MKWAVKISDVGTEVKELYKNTKQFDFVVDGKRKDMNDYVVHFAGELPAEELTEGDEVVFGDTVFYILALGKDVNRHIREHGACTMDFSGGLVAKGPCVMMLDGIDTNKDFLQAGIPFCIH